MPSWPPTTAAWSTPRARKPKDKGRVERPIPYVRDSFWRGRQWTSLEQMQAKAIRWSREVAGSRQCRPLDNAAPLAVFTALEAPALRPLPKAPFTLATWAKAKVGTDIHVRIDGTWYSIPWRFIGKDIEARSTFSMVQFFHRGELIKTYPRKIRGKQTDLNDYPPEKIAFHMRTPTWCREKAAEIGPSCTEVIDILLTDNALYRLRSAQGVISLADKHQPGRLEQACAKAIQAGAPSYRTINGILAAGTEVDPEPPRTGDGGAAAFLHGPDQLFADVIPLPITADDTIVPPSTTITGGTAGEAS